MELFENADGQAQQERSDGCTGEQERTHHLGIAEQRHYIPPRSHFGSLCYRSLIKTDE